MKSGKYVHIETEYNKKYISKNPIIIFINNHFLSRVGSFVESINCPSILDVGCGEGIVTNYLTKKLSINESQIAGLDIDINLLKIAKSINPRVQFHQGSVYELPFQDNSFDLVLALEILEHLEFPERAIKELNRVSNNWVFISVPNDRMFRFGNIMRFKYISSGGKTPDHIQHWNKKTFKDLISRYLNIVKIKLPCFLWLMLLCRTKK